MEILATNVNDAFAEAWWRLRTYGVEQPSRNGPVLVMPEPVMTAYQKPTQRVLWDPRRDANHIFHLVEAMWMFAGRDDVESLLPFNSNYKNYAEPDGHVHGAYGYRWRKAFGKDQILEVIDELRRDPNSRRAVITMWDPTRKDMGMWKDTPCNTHIYFDARDGVLNMTVCCRSNDVLWGCYGANVVHFSFLLELVARGAGLDIGVYRQFSNNFHAYTEREMVSGYLLTPPLGDEVLDLYSEGKAFAYPLLADDETPEEFLLNCEALFDGREPNGAFLSIIVAPLMMAYTERKEGLEYDISSVPADCDWRMAFEQWVSRRKVKEIV